MIEENDPNKLIEGEDFITRLKVINALPKTPPEKGYCCKADAVIVPYGWKKKQERTVVIL
jgi:hypothetical protein